MKTAQSQIITTLWLFQDKFKLKLNFTKKTSSTQDSQEPCVFYKITDWLLLSSSSVPWSCQAQLHFQRQKALAPETHMISPNRVFPQHWHWYSAGQELLCVRSRCLKCVRRRSELSAVPHRWAPPRACLALQVQEHCDILGRPTRSWRFSQIAK